MEKKESAEEGSNQAIDSNLISFEERLAYDKLTFFYISLPIRLLGQLFAALLFAALELRVVELYSIGVWLLLSIAMLSYRFYHYIDFRRQSEYAKLRDAKLWLHRYYTNVVLSGMVWGSSAVLMFPKGDLVSQMVVVLFLFTISFTAMGILASKKDLLLSYAAVMFVPLILRLFFIEEALYTNIAFIVIALMLISILAANYIGQIVNNALSNHQHFIEIKHSHEKLKERFFSLFERAPIGIYYYNPELKVEDINERFRQINRVEYKEDIVGQDLRSIKNYDIVEAHERVFKNQTGSYRGPFPLPYVEDMIYVDFTTVPMLDGDGGVTGGITILNDITEEINAKEEMTRNAYYDMLTNIPNRTLLMDKLSSLIDRQSSEGSYAALLFCDIDNFKSVNDNFGHNVGDLILRQVAYLIEESITDRDTVARIGGDKFVVLLPWLSGDKDTASQKAMESAMKIKKRFTHPLTAAGQDHRTTLSIGMLLFSDGDVTAFDILKRAETAMYEAKKSGRNTITLYQHRMGVFAQEQLTIETDLHKALQNGELRMHYQPQIDIKSGEIISAEALVRWFHPEKGLIPPGQFIPVAEESGMIFELESWIFEQILIDMKRLSEPTGVLPVDHIAINVSAVHFLRPHFAEQFKLLVEKHHIPPEWIELELTESEVMRNIHDAIKKIKALKKSGFTFSIDDFGTGYSSLSYLKQLPIDVLKIDQSFVLNMADNQGDAMIVGSVVSISKKFGLKVLAEGVENMEALERLRAIDCDLYQGFYGHKPMSLEAFEKIVKTSSL